MRISDWSSDVCSSDLHLAARGDLDPARARLAAQHRLEIFLERLLAVLETGRDVERVLRIPICFGIGGADIADHVADRGPGRVIAGETARLGDAGADGEAAEERVSSRLANILLFRARVEPRGGI